MTRYKVRVELIEVITDEETGNTTQYILDAIESKFDSQYAAETVVALCEKEVCR